MVDKKQLAAHKAVAAITNGMIVGLGTGSTAAFAIEALGQRVQGGLNIQAVCSSIASENLAAAAGITLIDFAAITAVDIYIDGADEVDASFNLIKGGGGALVREKIVAFNSKKFVVIVDSSKRVQTLGRFPLPVEVVPFAVNLTTTKLEALGARATLRQRDGHTFVSDNGNYIIDLQFDTIETPTRLDATLNAIPGVVESGLFPAGMVHQVITGFADGHVDVQTR